MELVILPNSKRCPACGRKHTVDWVGHTCVSCHARLLKPDSNFAQVQREALLSYWVWFDPRRTLCQFHGWVFSSQLNNPQPNTPEWIAPEELPADYGKQPRFGTDSRGRLDHKTSGGARVRGGFKKAVAV